MGKIVDLIGLDEVLVQLAEEACELAKAALKYRRTIIKKNPTTIGKQEAYDNLVEEAADVELCMREIGLHTDEVLMQVSELMEFKGIRWQKRLAEIRRTYEEENDGKENSKGS